LLQPKKHFVYNTKILFGFKFFLNFKNIIMKTISKILIALFVLLSVTNSFAQISKAEIVATGLTCSMCSNAINKQLKKLPEVEKVDIDLNTNTFTISLKKNNNISPKILKESVQKAGFFVGSMVISIEKSLSKTNYVFINGDKGIRFKVLDKGFVPTKEFKKNLISYSKTPNFSILNEDNFYLLTVE
jgi:copper chaperone CopZ